MNNNRRKYIRTSNDDLDTIKDEIDAKAAEEEMGEAGSEETLSENEENWSSRVDDIRSNLEPIKDDEQDYYDNMPESLQGGKRGDQAQEAVNSLERAIEDLDELLNVEEVGSFTRLFHEKYDNLCAYLESAAD